MILCLILITTRYKEEVTEIPEVILFQHKTFFNKLSNAPDASYCRIDTNYIFTAIFHK
jgi:hypothetical protein